MINTDFALYKIGSQAILAGEFCAYIGELVWHVLTLDPKGFFTLPRCFFTRDLC